MSQARLQLLGQSEGVGRYALAGVLDFQTVPGLLPDGQRMLAGEGPLELDLVEVREANSAGLALLLEWVDLAARRGRPLRLYNLPESLANLADLANLGPLLPLADL
ncbi:MAG: STAS domain-containing protein [Chromatiaceae bacterium]